MADESLSEVAPGTTQTLSVGELLLIPPGSAYSMLNLWQEPASVLSVSVAVASEVGHEPETMDLQPHHGISFQTLLSLPTSNLDGLAPLRFGSVSLMPGGRLTVDPATSLMVLWTGGGELYVDGESAHCREGSDAAGSPTGNTKGANIHVLCPTDSKPTMVFNGSSGPAHIWIIAVSDQSDSH